MSLKEYTPVIKDRFIRDKQAEVMFDRKRKTLWGWIKTGKLPEKDVKIGGASGWKESDLRKNYRHLIKNPGPPYKPEYVPFNQQVTKAEAMEIFHASRSGIDDWVEQGVLPPFSDNKTVAIGDLMKVLNGEDWREGREATTEIVTPPPQDEDESEGDDYTKKSFSKHDIRSILRYINECIDPSLSREDTLEIMDDILAYAPVNEADKDPFNLHGAEDALREKFIAEWEKEGKNRK